MYRRCKFLELLLDVKFNLGVDKISGETQSEWCYTFISLMLEEVAAFVNPRTQGPWSKSIPLQVKGIPSSYVYNLGEVVTG